ncbi:MAG: hypothetical protein LLG06_09060 [Desulfobacteraceae bacterium]|nr:hypothetical protein [Desulfobacteraceae bacterium]
MNKEERMRVEAGEAWAEIDSLIMRMRTEESSAESELDALCQKLPEVLVQWARGMVPREDVNAVKARIAELRELIGDVPIILRELESEKRKRCFRQLQDAGALSRERERYNLLKARISEEFEPSLVEELRRSAKSIGEEEDCEQFLACFAYYAP